MTNITKLDRSTAVANLDAQQTALAAIGAQAPQAGGDPILKLTRAGEWVFGANADPVDEEDLWAVHPYSFQHGYVSWGEGELYGEVMVPAASRMPDLEKLERHPAPWETQLGCVLVCVDGPNKGQQAIYKSSSRGGMTAIGKLAASIAAQMAEDSGAFMPVVALDVGSYQHKKYGQIFTPDIVVEEWVSPDADEFERAEDEAPEPEPKAAPVRKRASRGRRATR
jgi:hypothetical protein